MGYRCWSLSWQAVTVRVDARSGFMALEPPTLQSIFKPFIRDTLRVFFENRECAKGSFPAGSGRKIEAVPFVTICLRICFQKLKLSHLLKMNL